MRDDSKKKLEDLLGLDGLEFINACYRLFLEREADQAGVQHHLDLLVKGMSKLDMVTAISSSPEYKASGRSNSDLATLAKTRAQPPVKRWLTRLKGQTAPTEADEVEILEKSQPASQPSNAPVRVIEVSPEEFAARAPNSAPANDGAFPNFWFDLTTSLQWTQGVVGIIRAELEIARNLKKIYPNLRFSMQVTHGFAEVDESELGWLLNAENVAEAYMLYFGRRGTAQNQVTVSVPEGDFFFHPFGAGDLIFSMGWKDSRKEELFTKLKDVLPEMSLAYLVFDVIMLRPETAHFYDKRDRIAFERYLKWISHNCDFLLFGGENTKRDVEEWQRKRNWPVLPGRAIRFGSDIVDLPGTIDDTTLLKELGVSGPFILAVGTAEPRKNYSTLYRAYLLAQQISEKPLPQLVICGQTGHRVGNLSDQMARDPRVAGRILRRTPNDDQLAALYRQCQFTLLPSFYEGWSLTLPESFAYGKLCLCADTPPLRETGGRFAVFIDPIDEMAWAREIIRFANSAEDRAEREHQISTMWQMDTWADSARLVHSNLLSLYNENERAGVDRKSRSSRPEIWMDLTLSYLNWNSSLTGVTRVELMYAKTLRQLDPLTRFFANDGGHFFEIDPTYLSWMDDNEDISQAYNDFNGFWQHHEANGLSYRSPLRNHPDPASHPAYIKALPTGSVAFFAGIDFGRYDEDKRPILTYTHLAHRLRGENGKVLLAHFMHDFTPSDWPQIHKAETVEGYEPFCDVVFNNFDFLAYGGYVAKRDGEALRDRRGWKSPAGEAVPLGFDIGRSKSASEADDRAYLKKIGLETDFVIAVGTLEPRKNHETLYRAYLLMLQRQLLERPIQMVFVGKTGWNNDDFLTTLASDERIAKKIIRVNPSDEGLDILYRNSLFTLMPSFYEGWSLPLPESFAYGKFCLVSDTPPLRERGGEFAEYISPLDAAAWAERIAHYANDPERLVPWENRIAQNWRPVDWKDATEILVDRLCEVFQVRFAGDTAVDPANSPKAIY